MIDLPWICERCGHFMVSVTNEPHAEPPQHDCATAGHPVVLATYKSSEQAAEIRQRLKPREPTPV